MQTLQPATDCTPAAQSAAILANIRDALHERSISDDALASALGANLETVRSWFEQPCSMPITDLARVAQFLGVRASALCVARPDEVQEPAPVLDDNREHAWPVPTWAAHVDFDPAGGIFYEGLTDIIPVTKGHDLSVALGATQALEVAGPHVVASPISPTHISLVDDRRDAGPTEIQVPLAVAPHLIAALQTALAAATGTGAR